MTIWSYIITGWLGSNLAILLILAISAHRGERPIRQMRRHLAKF